MAPSLKAFDAWAHANAEATAAERKVQQAAVEYAYGRAGPPPESDLQDAFMKRLAATKAFEEVLREQTRIARQLETASKAASTHQQQARSEE